MKTGTHFVSLSENPYSRRGSHLALFNDIEGQELFGKAVLYIGSTRGGAVKNSAVYRQVKAEIVRDNLVLPTVITLKSFCSRITASSGSA
ncbi:MAG: hypothetical protein GX254_00575 [Clostridiales bacterium]|jgi:hypothetical protein|nr:hypothetical protein [Clostridiales bacterium]